MQVENNTASANYDTFNELNKLIECLYEKSKKNDSKSTHYVAIDIANEILKIIGIEKSELKYGDAALDESFQDSKFKNQKQEIWYKAHPYLKGARIALQLYKGGQPEIECNFFSLKDGANKAKIAASTRITQNWEDGSSAYFANSPLGIDFFLSAKGDSLTMTVSKYGNLRLIEFNERLSYTQIEILNNLKNSIVRDKLISKASLHEKLWGALELMKVNKDFYIGIANLFNKLCKYLEENKVVIEEHTKYSNDVKLFASRLIGRLLFVWFLRKKNLISTKFGYFNDYEIDATQYYQNKLKLLFFDSLNTVKEQRKHDDRETVYLNGGLFDPHENDWVNETVKFPNNWFGDLYAHLNKFNFTTDESSPEYEQVAVDPEMLGRVFENLLATIVSENSKSTKKATSEKKEKGAFYTPRLIVSYMCKEALKACFREVLANEKYNNGIDSLIDDNDATFMEKKSTGSVDLWGVSTEEVRKRLADSISSIKILDPACGSGAFPMGLMQLIVKVVERLSLVFDESTQKFRPADQKNNVYKTKLAIVKNMIFGSDIDPMAVEISRLRVWLSLIIESNSEKKDEVEPLPNLDFHFVCSNSLVAVKEEIIQGDLFNGGFDGYDIEFRDKFNKIVDKYFDAHTRDEKNKIKKEFEELQKINPHKKRFNSDQLLSSWNPFDSKMPAGFFDSKIMFNVEKFDILIGNPPYIHFEDIKELSKEVYAKLDYLTYAARGDMYTLFYEMGINNLKSKTGILSYITSNKWMRTEYGEKLRNYFVKNVDTLQVVDLGSGVFTSATVDTNIILIRNSHRQRVSKAITVSDKISELNMSDFIKQNAMDVTFEESQPWVILNKIEQQIKEKIEKYGIPLKKWPGIKINYGIKTGCNEAFIINEDKRKEILSNCITEEERKKTDKLIRPILRGKDIKCGSYNWAGDYLISTHNGYYDSKNCFIPPIDVNDREFPSLKKHLDEFYDKLYSREDKGYTPYNLRSCAYMDDFDKQKILYSEISQTPCFFLDEESKFCILNTAYYLIGDNMKLLVDYLNSQLSAWIFKKYYAGGGLGDSGYRYLKNTIVNLPIPSDTANDFFLSFRLSTNEITYIKNSFK